MVSHINQAFGLIGTMRRDPYLTMAAIRREGMGITVGFASAARRCPDRPALVDELGTLTWRQLDERINALAAALQGQVRTPTVIGIMCRNHRGFVEALVAATRTGSDILLLNTSFAGSALADVVNREGVDTVIYDEEFTATLDRALADRPAATPTTPGTLKQHVRDNLANYKVPREIVVLDELPRSSTGKVLRAELQSRASG